VNGKILIIAGSDSGGGAGIQADIKTVTSLGGYAATAITALTAQNTTGVQAIHEIPNNFISKQIESVLSDIGANVIKTGMLLNIDIIKTVADSIELFGQKTKLVIDPVMIAKGGVSLLLDDAISALKTELFPKATLVTPNIPEAEAITGDTIKNIEDMKNAGKKIITLGTKYVLIKGGHLDGDNIVDVLVMPNGVKEFFSKRIDTKNTHGTGCTLASAIATYLAQGKEIEQAVELSIDYVKNAIKTAPNIGNGHGPLNHNNIN
jgi:hydroxymethylpyrimidine/phosphomethylpyrimidine kinase